MALVDRGREVVAAVNDDFFQDDTILYYLNRSQRKVVSFMVNKETVRKEPVMRKSLRALDKLRKYVDVGVDTITFTGVGVGPEYYKGEVPLPTTAGTEINQFLDLNYDESTVLRELNTAELSKLEYGNLKPSEYEGYYYVTLNSADELVFETYLHEDASGDNPAPNVRIRYIKNPTDLTLASDDLPELPEQLENAVLYGAAMMMLMQESTGDQQALAQVQMFSQLYQEELQTNTY